MLLRVSFFGPGDSVGRMEVVVIVRADMPDTAAGTNVVVRVPMPRSTVSVNTEVGEPVSYGALTSPSRRFKANVGGTPPCA